MLIACCHTIVLQNFIKNDADVQKDYFLKASILQFLYRTSSIPKKSAYAYVGVMAKWYLN
jgi:hypothetical protein